MSNLISAASAFSIRRAYRKLLAEAMFTKVDMNSIVMDYLINEGYPMAAEKFATEANCCLPINIDSIHERVEIRNAILAGDIIPAIKKINDLNPEILDRNPALHFSLLRLQLIELIKSCTLSKCEDITPVLEFASTHLAPRAATHPTFLSNLEHTMALLIFPFDSISERAPQLACLLEPRIRIEVAGRVNEAILASQGLDKEARIRGLLRLRVWAEEKMRKKGLNSAVPLPLGTEDDIKDEIACVSEDLLGQDLADGKASDVNAYALANSIIHSALGPNVSGTGLASDSNNLSGGHVATGGGEDEDTLVL